ncbi:hypothetical protein Vafri_5497 [Volvox africanus]|uniref:Uncharacterized protein n=1 Tax=Volvox africanus TaxID=51714 RepID=A0A8J4EVS9_9CHLO|nr:hypothetical protein Vafri_5497 [Volvox africanus]
MQDVVTPAVVPSGKLPDTHFCGLSMQKSSAAGNTIWGGQDFLCHGRNLETKSVQLEVPCPVKVPSICPPASVVNSCRMHGACIKANWSSARLPSEGYAIYTLHHMTLSPMYMVAGLRGLCLATTHSWLFMMYLCRVMKIVHGMDRSSSISRCRFVGRRDARAGAVTVSPSQRSCISSTDVPSPTPPTSPLLGPSLGSC